MSSLTSKILGGSALLLALAGLGCGGQEDGPAERAGRAIDDAVEDTGKAVEKAAEDAKEKMDY